MNVFKLIYHTHDVSELLNMYKNINTIDIFSKENTLLIQNYIVEKIIYKIYNVEIDINNYCFDMLNENDKFRIYFFNDLMSKIINSNDPLELIIINLHNVDHSYVDNKFLIPLYYKKFKKIIHNYNCIELIYLYENITSIKSIITNNYLYIIYDEIVDFIFSLSPYCKYHFYMNHLINDLSIFKKLNSYYDDSCWLAYYLIYICESDDLYQLC